MEFHSVIFAQYPRLKLQGPSATDSTYVEMSVHDSATCKVTVEEMYQAVSLLSSKTRTEELIY